MDRGEASVTADVDAMLVERPRRPVTPERFAELVRLAPDASAHAQHGFAEALERHAALGTDTSAAGPWLLSRLATPPGDAAPTTWPAAAAAAAMAIVAALTQGGARRRMLDARWKRIWSVEAPDRSWELPRDRAALEERARAVLEAPIRALANERTQVGRLARFVEVLRATEKEEWTSADALAARVPDDEVGAIVWTLLRAADDVDLPVPLARGILGRVDALRPRFPADERTKKVLEDRLHELAKKWNLRVSISLAPGAIEAKLLRARPGKTRDRLLAELRGRIEKTPSIARDLVPIADLPKDGPRAELAALQLLGLVLEHDVDGIRTHFALLEQLGLSPLAATLERIPPRDRLALLDVIALRLDSTEAQTRWWALRFVEDALTEDDIETAPYAAALLRGTIDTELLAHRQEAVSTRARAVLSLALERTRHRDDFVAAARSIDADLDPDRRKVFRAQLRSLFPDALTALGKKIVAVRRPASEAALLAAVYEDPDDDGARLVYADALLEVGDARGELIVLQCDRAEKGSPPTAREQELLRMNGRAWTGALAPALSDVTYERGFLTACTWALKRLGYDDDAVVGNPIWQTVEALTIAPRTYFFADLVAHPALRRLQKLAGIDAATFASIQPRDASRALEHVTLTGPLPNDLEKLVRALARYPHLRQLDVEQDPRELLARATTELPSLATVTFKKRRFDRTDRVWRESRT